MTKILRSIWSTVLLWPFLGFALLNARVGYAQVSAYTFAASSGTFTPLPAGATSVPTILADDIVSGLLPLGFNFVFDGVTYTQVKASSNGFLSFNPSAASSLTNNLATGSANDKPIVAPFWDDLDGRPTGITASASYTTTGTAPSRVFTFEWRNWEWTYISGAASISFQAKLYEGTNRIEFVYHPESGTPSGGVSASIGIAGATSTGCTGEFLSLNNTSTSPVVSSSTETKSIAMRPADGQVYAFTPPPPVTTGCAAVRCANVSNVVGTNAQLNFSGNSSATSYTVTYQAAGGQIQTVTPAPVSSPVTLTGLTLSTGYTATVTANCASGASTPVTLSFTTSNGYCTGPGTGTATLGGGCASSSITAVAVVGTPLNATGLTCTSVVLGNATTASGYTNYPATAPYTGTLFKGGIYPISVTTTSGTSIISVWIDFNHDYAYTADEWVQVATAATAGSTSVASITIPATAAVAYTGPTGMRVRSRSSGNANAATDACSTFGSGETKDFIVNIAPEPPCPQPTALTSSALTTTTATLSFNAPGAGTYTLVYGLAGFNPTTGGTTVTATSTATTASTLTAPITGLQAGTTYQFYVTRNCGGALGSSVASGPISFSTSIANDDACGATQLTMSLTGCQPFATTSTGATTSTTNGYTNPTAGCGVGAAPKDVWFKFTTAASGPGSVDARITVTGVPAGVVQVLSAASCAGPFTVIRCAAGTATAAAPNLDLLALTPSTTYYLRVYGYSTAATAQPGPFTICVTPLPFCPTPTAVGTSNVTKNSAVLTWLNGNAPANSNYTIIYGPPGFNPANSGSTLSSITGNSYTLTGLTSLTDYCFYIQLTCGGLNGSSTQVGPTCFQTLLETPANDDPCGAVTVASGATVSGTTAGATTSLQDGIDVNLPACTSARLPRDVWYAVTPASAANGISSMTLTLTGTAAGMVRLFTANDCASGPFAPEGCQAASASNTGFGAPITFTALVPGQRYYVGVSGYGSSDAPGPFTMAVTTATMLATATARNDAALQVAPNPSNTGSLTVRYSGATSQQANLMLYNILGQQVTQQLVQLPGGNLEYTLNTRGLASGLYTLRLQLGEQVLTRKVVLE